MRRATLLLATIAFAGCGGGDGDEAPAPRAPDRISLESPAFRDGGTIPRRFTCDGPEVSPPLRWRGLPARRTELLLMMEDPDAPQGTFVHWVVAHISAKARGMPTGRVPAGSVQLEQTFGKRSYGGPCPPEDDPPHHYVFTVYSLERRLPVGSNASPGDVRSALKRAVSARGRLRAVYGR